MTGLGPKIVTHTSLLKEALNKQPTQGISGPPKLGYAIRYAYQMKQADGSQRIILITDRKVGAIRRMRGNRWQPTAQQRKQHRPPPQRRRPPVMRRKIRKTTPSQSSELRIPATGLGEGKLSLDNPISVDGTAKTLAIENYGTLPVVLKGVKKAS